MTGNTAYLLLGGNSGNVWDTFHHARQLIESKAGAITRTSSVYASEAWGFHSEDLFLNQALELKTLLSCELLLDEILKIEGMLGRIRNQTGYESRTIDIDILFYNHDIIELPHLIVPHPRIYLRNFALAPMSELMPDYMHPVFKKTISQLSEICPDNHHVLIQNSAPGSIYFHHKPGTLNEI